MPTNRRLKYLMNVVMLGICLATAGAELGRAQATVPPPKEAKTAARLQEFVDRVQAYVNLHKTIESSLPALNQTDRPEKIADHQQPLAHKVCEARRHAK